MVYRPPETENTKPQSTPDTETKELTHTERALITAQAIREILERRMGRRGNRGAAMISFRDVIAGILIGAVQRESWLFIVVSCFAWSLLSCLFVSMFATWAQRKPLMRISFLSPAMSRFVVWWTTAFAVSLLFASITVLIRNLTAM